MRLLHLVCVLCVAVLYAVAQKRRITVARNSEAEEEAHERGAIDYSGRIISASRVRSSDVASSGQVVIAEPLTSIDRIAKSRSRPVRICWGFWRIRACLTFSMCGSGRVRMKLTLFDREVFNGCYSASVRLRVPKSIFPRAVRWLMRTDLYIYIWIRSLDPPRICFQARVKIRCGRWLRGTCTRVFPRRPYCVTL